MNHRRPKKVTGKEAFVQGACCLTFHLECWWEYIVKNAKENIGESVILRPYIVYCPLCFNKAGVQPHEDTKIQTALLQFGEKVVRELEIKHGLPEHPWPSLKGLTE